MKVPAFLAAACLVLTACSTASAEEVGTPKAIEPTQKETVEVVKTASVQEDKPTVQVVVKKKRPETKPPCNDRVVRWIWEAGIRGQSIRVAWAIAQRESNGNPNESTYPDLGIVQLNHPSWSGSKYWPANIYDPVQSFKALKKMVRDMNWQPWGLRVKNEKVSYDFSAYGGWSSWHHQNWIVIPFERYYSQFPNKCARNL